ncbi:hypothetical protein FGO68_gene1561 [Halteria grandinella]|uniref:Uncharacterized protein n=1 Tax=Halteria grandinella TaxID=5974 RepID=A0A8J8NKX0_HALGN|nr:hypothetical protein FGO68_gene1561 [Halteria grandinella]
MNDSVDIESAHHHHKGHGHTANGPTDGSRFIHSLRGVKKMKDVFYVRKRHIKHGYRAHECMTVGKCSKSLFMLHNETFNVWTHLLCGLYYIYHSEFKLQSSYIVMVVGSMACITCMVFSAIYHLYNSVNRDWYNTLLKFDLIGIGFKITGLAITLIYTGFHNFPNIGNPLAILLLLMMFSNLGFSLTPCYMDDKYSYFRATYYLVLVLSLFLVALSYTCFIATDAELHIFFTRLMVGFAYIGIGFFFYASGFPERASSNYWVQIVFQGHVWWHMLVFANGYTLYWILYDALMHVEGVYFGSATETVDFTQQ